MRMKDFVNMKFHQTWFLSFSQFSKYHCVMWMVMKRQKLWTYCFPAILKRKKCYELASFFNGYRLYLVNISNSNITILTQKTKYWFYTLDCRQYVYMNTCSYPLQMDIYYTAFVPSISFLAHGNILELYFACHS